MKQFGDSWNSEAVVDDSDSPIGLWTAIICTLPEPVGTECNTYLALRLPWTDPDGVWLMVVLLNNAWRFAGENREPVRDRPSIIELRPDEALSTTAWPGTCPVVIPPWVLRGRALAVYQV